MTTNEFPAAGPARKSRLRWWLSGALLAGLAAYLLLIRDFLSLTRPVPAEVLILEAWFPQSPTMLDAADFIRRGHYRQVLCVAIDESGGGVPSAKLAAQRLSELGVDPGLIQVLVVPYQSRHKTYSSAVAARDWLRHDRPGLRSVDVFTIGAHARKTLVFYRKAFPPEIAVGIVAGKVTTNYPFSLWWLSRRGIFVIVRNTIGYVYALAYSP